MVGRGNRKDEGSFTFSNSNVFAALESLKKKKKSDKEKGASKGSKATSKGNETGNSKEKQVFWAPAPLTVKSWADVDDEDDDDYYATTAPPQAIWGGSGHDKAEELPKPDVVEHESEIEDELLDDGDDDVEDELDHGTDVQEKSEPVVTEPFELRPAHKEAERQLSKKERRRKELAELEAILADFGVNPKERALDEQFDASNDREESQLNGDAEKKGNSPAESKTAKKKKKKDKASKEMREHQDQTNSSANPSKQEETAEAEPAEEDGSAVDVKGRLKKAAPAKKKKSSKEMDAPVRAASMEAAARNAKLAAAKKKEKNHYNQQPVRLLSLGR